MDQIVKLELPPWLPDSSSLWIKLQVIQSMREFEILGKRKRTMREFRFTYYPWWRWIVASRIEAGKERRRFCSEEIDERRCWASWVLIQNRAKHTRLC